MIRKTSKKWLITLLLIICYSSISVAQQTIQLSGKSQGKRFDGIGVVNGGGATSVLLKDYPEQQRNEIMDMVYKPMFGGSVSSLLVEIPGDGNCTLVITRVKRDQKELIGGAEQQAMILARTDMEIGGEYTLASVKIEGVNACQWHSLKLRLLGDELTGFVDGKEVVKATSAHYLRGMAGLMAPLQKQRICTPYFDNLKIQPIGRTKGYKRWI